MYKKIYVPVDNSAHSNRAIEAAVLLGKAFDAELLGDAVVQQLETSPRANLGAALHPGRVASGSGPRVVFTGEGSPIP